MNRDKIFFAGQLAINLYVLWKASNWLYDNSKDTFTNFLYRSLKNTSFVKNEINKIKEDLRGSFKRDYLTTSFNELPSTGLKHEEILTMLEDWASKEDKKWKYGFVSGAVYHGEPDHQALLNEAYKFYSLSNPLHPDVWPSLRKMEAEVVSMTAKLVNNNNPNVCGCLTSGGTESIILSVKAHRDWAEYTKGINRPEMIIPITAHAAFEKAAKLMKIKLIKIPVHQGTFQVYLNKLEQAINSNTIMIVGSAPQFPHGIVDPIEQMSDIAVKYKIGLHVDACLGGFILPFSNFTEKYDFELPGVTAMSLDTHKFGYAPKGSSVILYKDEDLRAYQFFTFTDWPGGLYATSNLPGSRVGGLSAGCWASMLSLGYEGYQENAKQILDATKRIRDGIESIEDLEVLGDPKLMVVAFRCSYDTNLNIYRIGDRMSDRGWSLNTLQDPASLHICVTMRHINRVNKFLKDLLASVELEKSRDAPKEDGHQMAPIYGQMASLPTGPIEDVLKIYQNVIWETE